MNRAVLFDTETTGLEPLNGDRVIEVAALELVNDLPTGRHFRVLIDPQRDVPSEASRIHGFTNKDLEGKPLFSAIAAERMISRISTSPRPCPCGACWCSAGRCGAGTSFDKLRAGSAREISPRSECVCPPCPKPECRCSSCSWE